MRRRALLPVLVPASATLALLCVAAHAKPKAPTFSKRVPPAPPVYSKVTPNTPQNPRLKANPSGVGTLPPRPPSRVAPRPPSASGLGGKAPVRLPSRTALTGATNPDPASAGLADERLRANATAPILTLEDALALSLANNPRLTEAQAAVNQATASIGTAGSAGKPQIGLSGSSTYGRNTDQSNGIANSNASRAAQSQSGSGGSGGNSGSGASSAASPSRSFLRADLLNVNASIPITTGGRVRASTKQARYNALAQIYQLAQTEQDLVLSTTIAYLDVLRGDQLLRVTNSNLAVSQERLRVAQVRYSVGAAARLDVLRAQTDLADARTRRIQAANQLGNSNVTLNTLLARPPDTPIRIVSIERLNLPTIPAALVPSGVGNSRALGGVVGTSGTGADAAPGANAAGATVFSGPSIGGGTGTTSGGSNSAAPIGGGLVTTPGTGTATGNALPGATGSSGVTGAPGTSATGTVPGAVGGTGSGTGTTGASPSAVIPGTTTATSPLGGSSSAGVGVGAAGAGSFAGTTRQSLAVTQAQIGAAEAAIEVAKSGKHPQLGLNIGTLLRNPATFLGNFGASIGLGLAQNLFDSKRTRSQVDEARAALEQLKARLAGQRLEVASAIETSLLTLDSAQRRQASAETGVASAREALRVANVGFRSGVRTTLDLADAQAALLAAETEAVNARFDVADAQATLAAAVGIYTVEAQQARERAISTEREAAEQARRQQEILNPPKKKKRKKFLGIF